MKTLTINKPEKYDICFCDSFSDLKELVSRNVKCGCKAFIVTDSNVRVLYLEEVSDRLSCVFSEISSYTIDAGEQSKTLENAEKILKEMISCGYNRDDVIIALGGGVVGDLAGFCASVYMRGIDFIQIPTTLLSQIDSSIGGKVAVDMDSYKNMIGSFHSPFLVYENSSCLKTLPGDQFLSGMGEVIKSALLGDSALWNYLLKKAAELNFPETDPEVLIHILYNTCCIKKRFVEEDPYDTGNRAVLNLGHTFGHAIEKCSDFDLSHGSCVALGTICAAYISMERKYISQEDFYNIFGLIKSLGLYVKVPEEFRADKQSILLAMSKDKKSSASGLKFILLEGIGNAAVKDDVCDDEIDRALNIIGIK